MRFGNLDIEGAIFDLDGTILDSMYIWDNVGTEFLRSHGIEPHEDADEDFKRLSLVESAELFKRQYGFDGTVDQLVDDVCKLVEDKYYYEVGLKSDVALLLQRLRSAGVPMCIATVTERHLAIAALKRNGIDHFFDEYFTVREVGASKQFPKIFEDALSWLGSEASKTVVFEDAMHAGITAKSVGLKVVGLYDSAYADEAVPFAQIADIYLGEGYEFARYL